MAFKVVEYFPSAKEKYFDELCDAQTTKEILQHKHPERIYELDFSEETETTCQCSICSRL